MSKKYYSEQLMICENEGNNVLKCRQWFHQYIVDMYAKIEAERLMFISFIQSKLRSDECANLQDAVVIASSTSNVGRLTNI